MLILSSKFVFWSRLQLRRRDDLLLLSVFNHCELNVFVFPAVSQRESKHLKMLSGIFSFKFRISLTLCWRSVVSCCCSPLAERAWSRILWTEIESLTKKFTVQQRQTASTNHTHARTDNRVRRWRPRLSHHVTNSMNIVTNCYIQLVYASPVWGFAAFVCCI